MSAKGLSVFPPLTHLPPCHSSSVAGLIVLNAGVNGLYLNGSLGKSGLDWKSLQGLKQEELGLVCFLCFQTVYRQALGESYPVILRANICVSKKT